MSSKTKKTWMEKLHDSKGLPKLGVIEGKMSKKWGEGTMVIPAPIEVDALMKKVPARKLTTINQLREALARKHKVNVCCPITTGIFAWIAAHASAEQEQEGKSRVSPYWRTLKADGELNLKYPGGCEALKARLEKEGHKVIQKGKRFFVADYEKSLAQLEVG
jgi:hypothetical protein